MAKKQLKKYKFVPGIAGSGRVVVEGKQDLYKLLLITNVTRGVILYNFADTLNTGATIGYKPGGIPSDINDTSVVTYGKDLFGNDGTAQLQNGITFGETVITFANVDTSAHSADDDISIFVEEAYQLVRTWNDFGTDAIERQRVANPQSQIDADFEYGLQGTKWQGYELVNQYPSIYERPGEDLDIDDIVTNNASPSLITVTTNTAHGLSENDPIGVQGVDVNATGFTRVQGGSLVYQVVDGTTFTFFAKGQVTAEASISPSITSPRLIIKKAGFYSGADLPVTAFSSNGATPSGITVHFSSPHGFTPGMPLLVSTSRTFSTGGASLSALSGSYFANSFPTPYQVQFLARGTVALGSGAVAGNLTPDASTNKFKVYTRPDGFFLHRPGDGGVLMGTASAAHGANATRQSKKYFRYQSGKGFLYTTGVLFAPNYDVANVWIPTYPSVTTASGGQIQITTSVPHGCQIGAVVRLTGVETENYDGTYTVLGVDSDVKIRCSVIDGQPPQGAGVGNISRVPKLYIYQWHGSCIRTGPHDDANGMFFEYDGRTFNVVKRTSTLQLAGTATLTPNSNQITGVGTLWSNQLKIGDKIVVKGMVHRVNYVDASGIAISVTPDFRGVVGSGGNYIYRVEELRVSQADFNYDAGDGTGPSGYKMDPNHMQMVGIQFTWYGAGFMDFMVRGTDANFIVLHRMKNNNVNTTASMRSANLPVRYDVTNESSNGVIALKTAGSISAVTVDTIAVSEGARNFYPDSGFIQMNYELIKYESIDRNDIPYPTLNTLTRCASANVYIGGSFRRIHGIPTPITHGEGSGIELVSLTASPNMSHWGSSYIMDGGFDFDRGYLFTYTATGLSIGSNNTSSFGLRLAPSASNGLTGDLGVKELLNRAQLLLQRISVNAPANTNISGSSIVVSGIQNPTNYYDGSTWASLNELATGNQPSFAQVAVTPEFTGGYDGSGSQIGVSGWGQNAIPGEKIFEFVVPLGERTIEDLSLVKELTQSAIGGTGTYPNGPDSIYINMQLVPALGSNAIVSNVSVTLTWQEAQA